jgi:hypothetical protein
MRFLIRPTPLRYRVGKPVLGDNKDVAPLARLVDFDGSALLFK